MIKTFDVGSTPFPGNYERFLNEASSAEPLPKLLHGGKHPLNRKYFDDKIIECFLDKVRVGIDIPNYPQFRDMNDMFLNSIDGIEKTGGGYVVTGLVSIEPEKRRIPEISVLEEKTKEICEKTNAPLRIRFCVTGPYTLSSLFSRKESYLFSMLGKVVTQIAEANVFDSKYGRVDSVAVDEPVFGLIDDPLLDYGSIGREELLKTWESIFHTIKAKNVKTCIHLHGTTDELFWHTKSLDIVESHVADPLYFEVRTKQKLEREDKFLKASIGITDFDTLINSHLKDAVEMPEQTALMERVADIWTAIRNRKIDPTIFLEEEDVMERRLKNIVRQFGEERVPYAGPECGLKSFPTYECAIECLKRISTVVRGLNKKPDLHC